MFRSSRKAFFIQKIMAKELPYFQFEPAEYLAGNISFCSLEAQGLFVNLCSYYWQRSCQLTKEQFLKRLNYVDEFAELVEENIVELQENRIRIEFLDEQYLKATKKSIINSINGSKGGRPKKENPKETQIKPNGNPIKSETKGIREDKIKEDKIKPFLVWFNNQKKKHTGTAGKFKMLSKTDKNNFAKLLKDYDYTDFEDAIPKMFANEWAKETNNLTPTHFLRNDNFNKYLNTEIKKEVVGLG